MGAGEGGVITPPKKADPIPPVENADQARALFALKQQERQDAEAAALQRAKDDIPNVIDRAFTRLVTTINLALAKKSAYEVNLNDLYVDQDCGLIGQTCARNYGTLKYLPGHENHEGRLMSRAVNGGEYNVNYISPSEAAALAVERAVKHTLWQKIFRSQVVQLDKQSQYRAALKPNGLIKRLIEHYESNGFLVELLNDIKLRITVPKKDEVVTKKS